MEDVLNPTTTAGGESRGSGKGSLIGSIIVIVILVIGAIYLFANRANNEPVPPAATPTEEGVIETPDEQAALEQAAQSASVNNLDAEVTDLENAVKE